MFAIGSWIMIGPSLNRLITLWPSGTLEVGRRVRSLRAQGIDVISLGGGQPDPQPARFLQAFSFSADLNVVGQPAGERELREAIAGQLLREQQLRYDQDGEIAVTVGAKHAVFAALLSVLEPDDEVILFDPGWVSYASMIDMIGAKVKRVSLRDGNRFVLRKDRLTAAVGPRTRAIVMNSPHNPTGRVFTSEELGAVADVAEKRDLWVIADESFSKFVFDAHVHSSIASLPGMKRRSVVVRSFSKDYALPGCRVGYIAAPEALCKVVVHLNEHVISSVSPLLQRLARLALEDDVDWTRTLRSAYHRKRDLAVGLLSGHDSITYVRPEGTFFLFLRIEGMGGSSVEIADRLLQRARVAVTPGAVFGPQGEGFVRISLGGPEAALAAGLERLLSEVP